MHRKLLTSLLATLLALILFACFPATAPTSAADSSSELPTEPADRAFAPSVRSVRASGYLAATATIDGENVLSEAPSESGVWVVEDERFVVMLSLSPDTIAQTTRSEWDAYVKDWGSDQANSWLVYVTSLLWPKQLNVTIENKTSRPVTVVWEESALISADGRSSRVIKSGVRFNEMDYPVPPTSIPPGARIDDVIAPVDRIRYSESRREWQQDSILYAADVGRAFSFFLALEVDGDKSYISVDLDVARRIWAFAD